MAMEYFTYPWMNLFFKEDTDKFYYNHLFGSLSFWPYGSMVDHFQHIVYDNPDLSPDERDEKWLELESVYRPDADFADLPHYAYGGMWQRQLHIYQYPFYYIDYCLAQYAAVSFFMMMRKNQAEAWQTYLALVKRAGLKDYCTLVAEAGFASPFEGDSLKAVSGEAYEYLESIETKFGS
jgi:oligoendopeptidase F